MRPPALTVRVLCSEDSCVPDSSKKDGKCWGSKVTIWLDELGGLVRATPKLVANHPKRLVINYLLSKKTQGAVSRRSPSPGRSAGAAAALLMDRGSPTEPPHLRARCGETNWTRSLTATPHAAAPPPPPLAPAPALDQPSTASSRPPRERPAARAARGSMKPSPVPVSDQLGRPATSAGRTNSENGDTRDDPPVSESEESSSSCSEWDTVEDSTPLSWVYTGTGPVEGWELRQSRPPTPAAALVSATSAAHAARVVSPRASEPPVPVIAELSAASHEEEEEAHRT